MSATITRNLASNTVYAPSARFDGSARALSEIDLATLAPGVFALQAHDSRSARFAPIPTIEIIRGLQREGFAVVGAKQSIARQEGRADFTKHLLRLRRLDDNAKYRVGDTVFEILLRNANDGTASYELLGGLFRIACLNSLVSMQTSLATTRVRHTGSTEAVMGKVIDGTFEVLKTAERTLAAPQDWAGIQLGREEREIFAEAAHAMRFADAEGVVTTPIQPEQMLRVRRTADRSNDLWTTFNVVQENVIRGGITAMGTDANNRPRRVTTRAVRGIDQDVRLNRGLWTLATRMAELKGVAA